MVKKLKKYLKFVICCALITSLIAPNYAALSATDGSAFVTKSEFDSALSDFNARLTTFEAGINSKIDSQVTSYLDRNGIWSGQEQVLQNNIWNFSKTPEISKNIVISLREEKSDTIVEQISKVGLAYVEWSIWGDATNDGWSNSWAHFEMIMEASGVSGYHLYM